MVDATVTVKEFFKAIAARDVDGALGFFAEDAVVESPMGPQRGKAEIRRGLEMMAAMSGGGEPPELTEGDGTVIARAQSPMGPITLGFSVDEAGLIAHQSFKMG